MKALSAVFVLSFCAALAGLNGLATVLAQDTSERPVMTGEREETLAPDEPAVFFSYLDNELVPYVSHVELVDVEVYKRCLDEGLADCERAGQAGIYRLPLHRDTEVDEAKEAINEAWQTFFDAVVTRVQNKVNAFPPPWNPLLPCGSHVDWPEVFRRQLEAVTEAYAEDQPQYWQNVVTALFTHVPLSLWWEGPFPLQQGAVLTAFTSLEPKPGQISKLFEEPRDPVYHAQPFAPGTLLPYTPDELPLPLYPGLEAKELSKGGNVLPNSQEREEGLEPATPLEQSQFGFGSFFEVWGDLEDTWFGKWQGLLYTPSIVGSVCLIPTPPFIAIVPFIPLPTFVPQVPRAFYGEVSVPEGYAVPRLVGSPLRALPDFDIALPQTPPSLPPQTIPDFSTFPAPVPCLPESAPWPPPGYEGAKLGPPPATPCPAGVPLPPTYGEPSGGG